MISRSSEKFLDALRAEQPAQPDERPRGERHEVAEQDEQAVTGGIKRIVKP